MINKHILFVVLVCLIGKIHASDFAAAVCAPESSNQVLEWQEEVRSGFVNRMLAGGGVLAEKTEQLEKDRLTLLRMLCGLKSHLDQLEINISLTLDIPSATQEALKVLRAENIKFRDQLRQMQNEKNSLLSQLRLPQEGHSLSDLLPSSREFVPRYNNPNYIKGLEDAILAKRAERSQLMGKLIFMDDASSLDQVFVILEQEKFCLISIIGYQTELNCLLKKKLEAMTEVDNLDDATDRLEIEGLRQENAQMSAKIERLKKEITKFYQDLAVSVTVYAASALGGFEYPPLPESDEDDALL